jgi:hypothetical protein
MNTSMSSHDLVPFHGSNVRRMHRLCTKSNERRRDEDVYLPLHVVSGAWAYRQISIKNRDMVYTDTRILKDMIEKDLVYPFGL